MNRLFQSFFLLLSTASDRKLVRIIEYLRAENRILRDRLPKRIILKAPERNTLLRYGKPLGPAIQHLITIVSPRTFQRWVQRRAGAQTKPTVGRPKTAEEIRAIVIRIAGETGFGLSRSAGELQKLGIQLSRITVRNILNDAGLEPSPKRGMGNWMEFVERHAQTLWACDFFVKKVWTLKGLKDYFVLVFLHVGSRRIHIAGFTTHPNPAWTELQARYMLRSWPSKAHAPTHLVRDCDSNYGPAFDAVFNKAGVKVMRVGPKKPVLNAHCERVVRTLKEEVLNHFIVFGEAHLQHLLNEAIEYYHTERPHQGLGNRLVSGRDPPAINHDVANDQVVCHTRLGGLLKSYSLKAG
ncbi:MAG: integrase core domain-containing protein [Gemmataceae bacterium]